MAYRLRMRYPGRSPLRMDVESNGEALREAQRFIEDGAEVDLYDLSTGTEVLWISHQQLRAKIYGADSGEPKS